MSWHRRLVSCFAIALLGAGAALPAYAQESTGFDPEVELDPGRPVKTLAVWDGLINLISDVAWRTHDLKAQGDGPSEEAVPSITGKWDKYVLTPDVKQRLDTLRARAKQESEAGNEAAVKRTIAEAEPLLQDQKLRIVSLVAYAATYLQIGSHRQLLEPWLARAPEAERQSAAAQMAGIVADLDTKLDLVISQKRSGDNGFTPMTEVGEAAIKALAQRRSALAKAQFNLPPPFEVERIVRTEACPPPVPAGADKKNVTLAREFPTAADYYPDKERRALIEGVTAVRVVVSDTGCVIRAELAISSGVKALDDAALRLAMAGKYVPWMKDGKPMPGVLVFNVKFELNE